MTWTIERSGPDCSEKSTTSAAENVPAQERLSLSITKLPNITHLVSPECREALQATSVPETFTWRTFGGDQVETEIRDQDGCGGCWAFAVAGILGDRVALQNGIQAPYPSTTWLLSAHNNITPSTPGCQGGSVIGFAIWLGDAQARVKLEKCWPFSIVKEHAAQAPDNLGIGEMKDCCANCCNIEYPLARAGFSIHPAYVSPRLYTKFFGVDILPLKTPGVYTEEEIELIIKDVQVNILTTGPVATVILANDNFADYWEGPAKDGSLYINKPSPIMTGYGHSMVIVGWGKQDGVRYWEVRNSWGETGGWNRGYAKIPFSTLETKAAWTGVDIPIYMNGVYNCGAVSFRPNPIPEEELNYYLQTGVLKKSESSINLLELSRSLITGFDKLQETCANYMDFKVGEKAQALEWQLQTDSIEKFELRDQVKKLKTIPVNLLYMPVTPRVGAIAPQREPTIVEHFKPEKHSPFSATVFIAVILGTLALILAILLTKFLAST